MWGPGNSCYRKSGKGGIFRPPSVKHCCCPVKPCKAATRPALAARVAHAPHDNRFPRPIRLFQDFTFGRRRLTRWRGRIAVPNLRPKGPMMSQLPLVGVARVGTLPSPRRRRARKAFFRQAGTGGARLAPERKTGRDSARILALAFAAPLLIAAVAYASRFAPPVSARMVVWACGGIVVAVCGPSLVWIVGGYLELARAHRARRARPDLRHGPHRLQQHANAPIAQRGEPGFARRISRGY
jgi:hypothetical protein